MVLSLLYLLYAIAGDNNSVTLYMLVFALASVIYLINIYTIKLFTPSLKTVFLFAVLFRVLFFFTQPSTSDDVYRYIWEGKVVLNGYNPFEYTPDSPALEELHTKNYPGFVSFPHMSAVYPPLSQYIFAAAYLISGESLFGLRLIFLLAELFTFFFILKILRLKNLPESYLLYYAWLPLIPMEYFVNVHIDVVGITLLTGALYYILKKKFIGSSLFLAGGILIKLYPVFMLVLLPKEFGTKKTIYTGIIIMLICIVMFLPFIPEERSLSASFATYMSRWTFYGSFYNLLYLFFSKETVRIILLVMMTTTISAIGFTKLDLLKKAGLISIIHIMFSATLFPWYLGYAAMLNIFLKFRSLIALFILINLTNFTPLSEVWREYNSVLLLVYIPFYILLISDFRIMNKTS